MHDKRPVYSDLEFVITKDGHIERGVFGKPTVFYDRNEAETAVQILEMRGAYAPHGYGITYPKHKWGYITRKRKDKLWGSVEA